MFSPDAIVVEIKGMCVSGEMCGAGSRGFGLSEADGGGMWGSICGDGLHRGAEKGSGRGMTYIAMGCDRMFVNAKCAKSVVHE